MYIYREALPPNCCRRQHPFVLISSSGTMAIAVKYGYEKNRKLCAIFLLLTAIGGATFVGMQAFEWTKLIVHEGIRPWANPFGAAQFGSFFFMVMYQQRLMVLRQ